MSCLRPIAVAAATCSSVVSASSRYAAVIGMYREKLPPNLFAEYDGTDFCGFQRQPNTRTVQGDIETALSTIGKVQASSLALRGAGRTDSGVLFFFGSLCINPNFPSGARFRPGSQYVSAISNQILFRTGDCIRLAMGSFELGSAAGSECESASGHHMSRSRLHHS